MTFIVYYMENMTLDPVKWWKNKNYCLNVMHCLAYDFIVSLELYLLNRIWSMKSQSDHNWEMIRKSFLWNALITL